MNPEEKVGSESVSENEEGVYNVEALRDHAYNPSKKTFKYLVKWEGYEESENTWEDEDNIMSEELLGKYWENQELLGISKEKIIDEAKGKRKSTKTPIRKRGHNGTSAGYSGKRFREDDEVDMGNDGFIPPPEESWEDLIESVDTVERNSDNKLIIYVRWKNGALTNHLSTLINKKCPQKIIKFYEDRLRFTSIEE